MNKRSWIFGLVTLLLMPLVHASVFDRIGSIWDTVLYIGGLGFLNLPGSNDIVLFLRFAIAVLLFSVLFALGVFAGKGNIQFLDRKTSGIIAAIISLISVIFIPSNVLIAIATSYGTLVSLILLAAPLVALVLIIMNIPSEPCAWYAVKTGLSALIMWILTAQKAHLTDLGGRGALGVGSVGSVNAAVDWAILIALVFLFYYIIKLISCALGGDDDSDFDLRPHLDRLNPFKTNDDDSVTNARDTPIVRPTGPSGPGENGGDNPTEPGAGAAGSLGEEVRAMFQHILERIEKLEHDMDTKLTALEAWLQTLDENSKLNTREIAKLTSYLETIKTDLINEARTVVHDEVAVLQDEINKLRTEMQVIRKKTKKFISKKHKKLIKKIKEVEKTLVRKQKKLIDRQIVLIEEIEKITDKIERIETTSVTQEHVREIIREIHEIREKIKIIERERGGIGDLNIDALVELLGKLELNINIEISGQPGPGGNPPPTTPTTPPRPPKKPRRRTKRRKSALEFYVNERQINSPNENFNQDFTDDPENDFTEIRMANGGGGHISYAIKKEPGVRVNIQGMQNNVAKGILMSGQSIQFSIQRTPNLRPQGPKTSTVRIRATEGRHHNDKAKHFGWFHSNRRWHYDLTFKIRK